MEKTCHVNGKDRRFSLGAKKQSLLMTRVLSLQVKQENQRVALVPLYRLVGWDRPEKPFYGPFSCEESQKKRRRFQDRQRGPSSEAEVGAPVALSLAAPGPWRVCVRRRPRRIRYSAAKLLFFLTITLSCVVIKCFVTVGCFLYVSLVFLVNLPIRLFCLLATIRTVGSVFFCW